MAAAATPTVTCPANPTVQFSVTDTAGDAFGSGAVRHDITSVSATADATTFCLTVNFAGAIAPADSGSDHAVAGFIDFDNDANPKTGTPGATDSFCPQPPRLGAETTLDLFSVSQGQARMAPGGELVPVSFEESSFTAAIPVSDLGGSTTFNVTRRSAASGSVTPTLTCRATESIASLPGPVDILRADRAAGKRRRARELERRSLPAIGALREGSLERR